MGFAVKCHMLVFLSNTNGSPTWSPKVQERHSAHALRQGAISGMTEWAQGNLR